MKTPKQKADWIARKHQSLFDRLLREAQALASAPGTLSDRAKQLSEITDTIASKVAPYAICRRGCSHCCHQAVIISKWEAERIGRAIGRAPAPADRGSIGQMAESRKTYARTACPFLKQGACSIYSARPLLCRTHFSMEDDASPCDTVKHPGARVSYFNFAQFNLASAMVLLEQPHADIREFFSDEP